MDSKRFPIGYFSYVRIDLKQKLNIKKLNIKNHLSIKIDGFLF